MLAAVEALERVLPGDLFLRIKDENGTRGVPNYEKYQKCENLAEVATDIQKQRAGDKAPEIIRSSL